MIYQLMRRDPMWKLLPWLALLSAVVWACPPPLGAAGAGITVMSVFVAMPHWRPGRLEAALPIAARDLVLSRALSLIATIWMPVLAGVASIFLLQGSWAAASKPLTVGALCTLSAAVAQSVWRKRLEAPLRFVYLPLFIWLPVVATIIAKGSHPLATALCAVAGLGLLTWTWIAAPPSFELGAARPKEGLIGAVSGGASRRPTFPWAPVIRSVWSWQYLFFGLMIGLSTASGGWPVTTFWVMVFWLPLRARTRWLWALPLARRGLLSTMMGPLLAAQVLGYLVSFTSHRRPAIAEPRVIAVTLGAILCTSLLTILLCVLTDWRGLARLSRRTHRIVFLPFFVLLWGGGLAVMALSPGDGDLWVRDSLAHVARTAAMGTPALIALTAAAVVALYLALEKVFREPDFTDKPKVAQPGDFA